jgi:hypothetical protein
MRGKERVRDIWFGLERGGLMANKDIVIYLKSNFIIEFEIGYRGPS